MLQDRIITGNICQRILLCITTRSSCVKLLERFKNIMPILQKLSSSSGLVKEAVPESVI